MKAFQIIVDLDTLFPYNTFHYNFNTLFLENFGWGYESESELVAELP
jgi:hypothetical protein